MTRAGAVAGSRWDMQRSPPGVGLAQPRGQPFNLIGDLMGRTGLLAVAATPGGLLGLDLPDHVIVMCHGVSLSGGWGHRRFATIAPITAPRPAAAARDTAGLRRTKVAASSAMD